MSIRMPSSLVAIFLRLQSRASCAAVRINHRAISSEFISLLLTYALLLQLLPFVAMAAPAGNAKVLSSEREFASNTATINGGLSYEVIGIAGGVDALPATIRDAVVSRHKPILNSGRIEGTLRVLSGESFAISSNVELTSDLYLPGTPTIQVNGDAQYEGTIRDGGAVTPANYTVNLTGRNNLPGYIHTNVDPVALPADFPALVPAASGTRAVTVHSQSDLAGIGNWQTVRDLSVSGNGLNINVPPGNYGTFTVNGNSRLNFTAGTYNFANTFNLDGSASIQATGLVVVNVAQNLIVASGALVLGSYTSPGDVHLNVLGTSLTLNGSSQVTGLVQAYNATATINGTAQVRGQVIANTFTLNGGRVIGAVWPAQSGGSVSMFGPRRFDRTTGPPNQYVEQFSLPVGVTSPYALHIQNGSLDGTNRVSSATVKLNGVVLLSPSDLNQDVAGVDRTVTLNAANTLEVSVASVPGSYLIINISGAFSPGDTTPPVIAVTSPANNGTTTETQISVSGTASDTGTAASGVAHVYLNGQEANYNSSDSTWTIADLPLNIGANEINARAVDHAGNQATASITVTRETPNQPPVVNAGADQTLALPHTTTLHGIVSDDGLPQGDTLVTNWIMVSGSGTVTFADPNALETGASFSSSGTYVLRLTAEDGALSSSDEITITVQPQNQPPTVVAGPDQTIALPHTATLNGSATDDGLPEGGSLAVAWTQIGGPGTATFAEPYLGDTTASFSEPGIYLLRLLATDSELSSTSELTITVQPQNQAPSVNAGPDQIIALPASALLNGSAADDGWPAGSSLTETWTVVSGPAAASLANPDVTVTLAMFSISGTYVLRLTVSDGELSNSDDVSITVDPQNQSPLVDAGPDQTITLPEQLNLNAVVNDDGWPRNSNVTISWSQVSGPGTATPATPSAATTRVSFSQAGIYVLRLTASDSQLSSSDEIIVIVIPENHPPTANAGADQTITLPNTAGLNGTASDDGLPAGSTLTTTWSKVSGPGNVTFASPNAKVTSATFSAAGTYVLRLTASDSALSSSDDVQVTVIAQNHAPTVNAGADQAITLPCGVALNGIVTDDGLPGGVPLGLSWTRVSGPGSVAFANAAVAQTTATFSASGKYVLRLTASDTQLGSSDDITITVNVVELGTAQYFGPTPYRSFADSPLGGRNASYFYLENFEDHLLNTPGVAASSGGVTSIAFGATDHDSVDADDGVIEGSGLKGDSYFAGNGAVGITFTFNAAVLGSLPTHAGLVWTDGAGQVYFEAFDHNGISMGLQGPFNFPDSVFNGTTAEDRFLGSYNKDGIAAIRVLNTVGGIELDHLQYGFSISNSAPIVNAGIDQNIVLPAATFVLNGTVNDDALPACSTLSISWSKVSGPGPVSFANPQAAQTTATLATAGQYVLRLTAGDGQYTISDDIVINLLPPNQAPVVSAGVDQIITLPTNTVSLHGTATDDGQPAGNPLAFSWSVLSGPGTVTFASANALNTTAEFSEAGTYTLLLTASDSQLLATDELVVIVNSGLPSNQPPTANAGPDQTITLHNNLMVNSSGEQSLVNGEIPGWTEALGTSWSAASTNSGSDFPEAQRGNSYFFAGSVAQAELRQDVDVSAFAGTIAAGAQQFEFQAYVRSAPETVPDVARVVIEYRSATNTSVIATLDSGPITSTAAWHFIDDTRPAPAGTGWIRVRLLASRNSGATNDAFFDSVSLRPLGNAAAKLSGVVADDGLPVGSNMFTSWTQVSGPGSVTFVDANAANASASFTIAGNYVLRLTAVDGQLSASDDVAITVNAANQPPSVNAGSNQTINLPAAANLNGTAIDDGLPLGSSLSISWSKLSGPGNVAFANVNSSTTIATFSVAGVYVLRFTADDTEEAASSEVTISVGSAAGNQPPAVSAGADQTVTLPTDTVSLNGMAADDGLPAGSAFAIAWTTVNGPGTVVFGNANSVVTTAHFSVAGTYFLRLTASDGELTTSDDVVITVTPALLQNQPPTAHAGPDRTILQSQPAQLNGSASDDGLPAGSSLTTNWTKVSGPGSVSFMNPNVTVTGAQFSATGTYVLRLTVGDGSLNASDDLTITVIDNVAPPTVQLNAPTDGSSVTRPMEVNGSVSNGAWQLEYSLNSDDDANNRVWTTFASGSGAITNGQLGILDPTMMLNGLFDIRLSATDAYGQTSRTSLAVVVERSLKVGNFTVSFSDLNVPVAGVPMEVTRTYDTRDKRVGDFGFGWTLALKNIRLEKSRVIGFKWYETVSQEVFPNYCLEATGSHLVTVTFPGGRVFKFEASVSPRCQVFAPIGGGTLTFTPLPGTHGTLEALGPAEFQVEGSIPGPVNLIGFGGGVDILNSSLFKFTAEDGTAYVIDQRAGLQSIKDTNNNTVTVSAGGIVHSSGKSITFNRDVLGRITSITDPAGDAQTYTYDAAGDLISYTDNENNTSTYTYDATHRLLTIHDPRGIQPIRNDYDADGRLLSHTDGFGKVISYFHNLTGRTETVTDRLGHAMTLAYDERGNVLSKTDARGGVTTFTYDANDNLLTETNALGKTTTYTYDANDHRTSVTDPLNNVTQFTYNSLGKVLTTTDPLGHVTINTYNPAGNLLTTKDALNNTTSFAYSVFDGQRTSMTDALNNSTHYEYSGGYLTRETDPLGHETTFTYDSNGNRLSQTVKRTNPQGQLETITTRYEYDKLNRLRKTTFTDGSVTEVQYNSIGQQSAAIDQLGHRTEFTYDEMGRLTRTTYPDSTHEDTTYDAEGRRLTSTDSAGQVTSYSYDELGRSTKTTYADGTFTDTSYDAAGRVLTTTDGRGNVTTYIYDDVGRRTKVRNALNQETTFTYDASGNQLSMTDALGHRTSFEYDLDSRRTRTVYADNTSNVVGYDALGRTVSKTDQAGKTTQFTYDALGRLLKVRDAFNQETTYGYNELGQQTSQTDANNHTTQFEYDQLGRRVKRILPAGQFETYSYENGGSLQSKTDFNGKTTTFTYDLMRRLLSRVPDASLNQATVSFIYNATGQRATMNDASGATSYTYDARNRLATKQTPFGILSYSYDEVGGLLTTRSSNANGVSVDYSHDSLNRLATVKDNNLLGLNGGVTNYTYDTVGNLQSYAYPNGVTTSYVYNSLNRLTTMTVNTPVSPLANYSYTLGQAGNRTAVTELGGRTVNYNYDDLYRLTSESIASDSHGINGSVSYGYDPVGNRLSRTSSVSGVPSQSSSYDANDRLTSDSYDNNGNTTSANGNGYAYDFENHLTSLNGSAVRYVYDGDGNRVSKTVGGVRTNYLVDTNNPTGYAQVVDELQAGAVIKSFTYGHDLISQRIVGGIISFYGYDGHGSVRQLTNASGNVTDTYDYDAFGNLISRTGATSNDYLYSGEQFDANLEFYYLRARYMNPGSGRFVSTDSFAGNGYDPTSLHKYLYANADPANQIDASGQFSLIDTVVTSTIIGAAAGFGLGFLTGGLKGAIRGALNGAIFGALIPLTGAGVGTFLLGNAARGVFIVGWGAGLGSAGVSGYSFATATTGEERFEAGVGLVASVTFMFVGPKILQYANTRTVSAGELNASYLSRRNGIGQPPWSEGTNVTETTIFRPAKYVRVFTEGQTKPAGAWVMDATEIEGLTLSQIQQKFALPFTPSSITTVDIPAGTTLRIGMAGENAFGPGGGLQVNIKQE